MRKIIFRQKYCAKKYCLLGGLIVFIGLCMGCDFRAPRDKEILSWQQSALEQYYNLLPSLKNDGARKQALDTLNLLIHYQKTGEINFRNENGRTLLAMAVLNGDDKLVRSLTSLEVFADVNLADNIGWTPLMLACFNEFDTIAQHLLNNGAYVNLRLETGDTALHFACEKKNQKLIKMLIDAGADVTIVNKIGHRAQDLIPSNQNTHHIHQLFK